MLQTKTLAKYHIALLLLLALTQLSPFGETTANCQPNEPGAGNCLSYDGVDDYVKVPTLTWTPTSFSVEWWLYPLSRSNWNQQLVANTGWNAFAFHTTNTGAVYVGTNLATRFTPADIPSNTVLLNRWQHFTFTFDNGTAKFYKNGVLLASKTGMTNPAAWNGFMMSPSWGGVTKIHGNLDEVRIWNYARTQTQIKEDMCKKLTGSESGLIGYWRLDESSGSTAFDSSPNNNDGTLQ